MTFAPSSFSQKFQLKIVAPLFLFAPIISFAGYAGGPYVVWVNLDQSPEKEKINQIVANFATSKSVNCHGEWKRGDSLLYMKKRPPLIDNPLIDNVFLKKNIADKKRLNLALKGYKDIEFQHYEGLDGVIVYANENGTKKMMSLTTGKKKIESLVLASHGKPPAKADIEDAFCALLPPITRLP